MAGKGGYMRPSKPAAVSGPGAMSQRTDGGPSVDNPKQAARYISGGSYGDGQEMMAIQQAAPMAEAPGVPTGMPMDLPEPVPFGAPTQRPDEPVTAGNPMGPGPGPEVMGLAKPAMSPEERERALFLLGMLQTAAENPGATQATREMVRRLRSVL
jgi:hypothetical protein